jgi:hypothetical protein
MRKLSIVLFGLLLLAACSEKKQADADDQESTKSAKNVSEDSEEAADMEDADDDEIQFVKASYMSPDSAMVVVSADVPAKGGTPLADSILAYLESNIGYGFLKQYNKLGDPRKAIIQAGKNHLESVQEEIESSKEEIRQNMEEGEELPDYMFAWQFQESYIKEAEGENYLTYVANGYEYQGGAHGMPWLLGTTFDKETGHRIGNEVFKNTNSAAFKSMFQKELLEYFNPGQGETLTDYLLIDINELEISNFRIADGNFIFQYQPYEISYFAAGLPCAIISFKQMKPYLTKEGLRLIGEE